ncbi:MAG: HAD family hydrolase [Anaerolineaceae bacterium]|nr:HAD family hydrolase [Anaerolineaceae bacterium]
MPLEVERIKAICFDVDGTLSDTDDQWVSRFERFFTPFRKLMFGYHPHHAARMVVMGIETPGNIMYHFLDILRIDGHFAKLYSFLAQRMKFVQRKEFLIVDGTHSMLQTLQGKYPMAVVSARDEKSTQAFLEQFNLPGHFQSVATSQTCRYTKPFPDPILKVAEDMGVKPEECLMIGDTTVDIRAGKSAGAQTLGVLCGFGTEDELKRAGADLILPTPFDMLPYFGLDVAAQVEQIPALAEIES